MNPPSQGGVFPAAEVGSHGGNALPVDQVVGLLLLEIDAQRGSW